MSPPRHKPSAVKGGGLLYRRVFMLSSSMLKRLDAIHTTWVDPAPGTSGSAILESVIKDLVGGKPAKGSAVDSLVSGVADAMQQLFMMRGAA